MTRAQFNKLKIGDYILFSGFTRDIDVQYNERIGKIAEDNRTVDKTINIQFDDHNYGQSKERLKSLISANFGPCVYGEESDLPYMRLFVFAEEVSEYED